MPGATIIDPVQLQAQTSTIESDDYQIGPTDLLQVTVFQVPALSFKEIRVNASGNIEMPLIGSVRAAGRTPRQLGTDIAASLGERYLRNPQVTVTVAEAASQKVTVDGAVAKPGVYLMRGRTTLLQAVATAQGPSAVADTSSVAVFRNTEAGRMVAVFDLSAIRRGEATDPVLLGDDVVVVDTSRLSVVTQQALRALPSAVSAAFRYW
jgi:polysaccharide export outer membrane protein